MNFPEELFSRNGRPRPEKVRLNISDIKEEGGEIYLIISSETKKLPLNEIQEIYNTIIAKDYDIPTVIRKCFKIEKIADKALKIAFSPKEYEDIFYDWKGIDIKIKSLLNKLKTNLESKFQ